MKKNLKKYLLTALCLSFVGSLGVGTLSLSAAAEENAPAEDILVTGASVYVGGEEVVGGVDKSGIRFQILAKKSIVESGAKINAVLLPADMTAETELKEDTVVIQDEAVEGTETVAQETLAADKWVASEYAEYLQTCVYLYNFPVNDYNREILCNAYIDGETDTYAKIISRSMAGVALAAEKDGDASAVNYIKSYHVNFYGEDGETEIEGKENVGVRYGSLVEKPENPEDTQTATFAGWYADKACKTEFDFTKAVKGTTNIYSKWEEKYVPPFATSVLINGGTVESKANFTYGDDATTATDWYYNKTTGTLTKTFEHQTGSSDFNDRVYLAEGQTGDFTFTVTATLEHNAGFEFTYNDGSAIKRFFVGRGWGGLRICYGDASTPGVLTSGLGLSAENNETTFKFVKTSSEMKIYITNATTNNEETLAITIASTGLTVNYGTTSATDLKSIGTAFSKMFEKHVAIGFTAVGTVAPKAVYKDISIVSEAITPVTFATSVLINGGTVTSTANLTYGTTASTTATDWYYNKTTGTLTKTFEHQTGSSDFNDRVYLAEGQTGDFTFTVTATLEHNAGFEFTYNDGSAIKRFFVGRGWGGLRICYGDASTPGVLTSGLGLSAENNETTFKFVKTSSEMKIYITNATTNNEETLAITIASTGLTVNYGTTSATDLKSIGTAFSKMFEKHVAIGFTAVGTVAPKAVYKNISIK